MIFPFWAKVGAIAATTVAALSGAFYLGTQHTQGKWEADKAARLALANQTLTDSVYQGYVIGLTFEEARRRTDENYAKIGQGVQVLDDPCRPSSAWWLLHDAAAGNRPAATELDGASTRNP